MKYIIDITMDNIKKVVAMGVTKGGAIWTDTTDIENLEELNSDYINEHYGDLQDEAYHRGLEDAWEAARKVGHCKLWDDYTKDTGKPSVCAVAVLDRYTASEAIEKLKAYEEKQKADGRIEVGDEVIAEEGKTIGIVTKEWGGRYYVMWQDGSSGMWLKESVHKTGRHFDIASILKEIQS